MADGSIYRITYDNGSVKLGRRKVLGDVLGAFRSRNSRWQKYPVKIERAPQPVWEDVTREFIQEVM